MSRSLLVEGPDDEHVVGQLLLRLRSKAATDSFGFDIVGGRQRIGFEGVVRQLGQRVRVSAVVGAVVDADRDPARRWQALRDRLTRSGYADVAAEPIPGGLVLPADPRAGLARVGLWMMPDNLGAGALEEFLRALAEADDLMGHAEAVVDGLIDRGRARFRPEADRSKAIVHSYLAWQSTPGQPYGLAIKARVFDADHALARTFVGWVDALFGPASGARTR